MTKFTHSLDEEQEKELEEEMEKETQIERPKEVKAAEPVFEKRLKQLVLDGAIGSIFDALKDEKILVSIGESLLNMQIFDAEFCKNNEHAWAKHLFVTKDFTMVTANQAKGKIENPTNISNDILRPVFWVARINCPVANANYILIILSSFECNHLMPEFRKSFNSTLFMYRPRLSNFHSNLIHEPGLQLSGMATVNPIDIRDEVQIGVYAGAMYFGNKQEQSEYCNFLGLIPKPWTDDQINVLVQREETNEEYTPTKKRKLFVTSTQETELYQENDPNQRDIYLAKFLEKNGFVPIRNRNLLAPIKKYFSECKFESNPTDLAIKLIKVRHQVLPNHSHVASILVDGIKPIVKIEPIDETFG